MLVDDLITLSMREIQVIADGEVPTQSEFDLAVKRFNTYLASLSNDMIFIYRQDVQEISTIAGTPDYITEDETYRVRHFLDDDINVLSTKDYDQYLVPNDNGRTDVYIDYGTDPPTIKFVHAPDVDGKIYKYRRDAYIGEFALGEEVTLTNNAVEFLILGLAFKLCSTYGVSDSKKASIKQDYNIELMKYKQAQTVRNGTEIVKPNIVIV